MANGIDRRQVLLTAGALALSPLVKAKAETPPTKKRESSGEPFRYCLNTSTIRGQKLSLPEQIDLAAKAGYDGIEPWLGDIQTYADQGGSLADLKQEIADQGLTIESAIGFARWIVDDNAERRQGLRDAERDMQLVKGIGGSRIAAPPVGATGPMELDLIAERYRALLEVGEKAGVAPQLELWGHSPAIHNLSQLAYIAIAAGKPKTYVLPDVYHIYKGGSDFDGLRMIAGPRIAVFHMNDYPAVPPRDTVSDQDRIYPGDGVAPLGQIIRDLHETGFRGAFSLELFNPIYWKQDPLQVAQTGLQKMRAAVQAALAS